MHLCLLQMRRLWRDEGLDGPVLDHCRHIHLSDCDQPDTGHSARDLDHMKTLILIVLIFTVPGVIMGLVSSYRAGQKPHEDLYRKLQKFTRRKK